MFEKKYMCLSMVEALTPNYVIDSVILTEKVPVTNEHTIKLDNLIDR